jgi:hypothetical protein
MAMFLGRRLTWSLTLLLFMSGSSTPPASPPPAQKWVGPVLPGPAGGTAQATIYYGPWQCRQEWLSDCQARCSSQGHKLLGCIWLADIKTDLKSRFLGSPLSAGGRLAIKHCCCDYPTVTDLKQRRDAWENGIDAFRRKWAKEFGAWPTEPNGTHWPGHHIWDLRHGGAPKADGNVLPVPPDTHKTINQAYLACYSGKGNWNQAGPYWPYAE